MLQNTHRENIVEICIGIWHLIPVIELQARRDSPFSHIVFGDFKKDEVYDEAKRVILETGQASVSMVQRRLGLGYTRAARLIDMMEEEGIVGPIRGAKPREVYLKEVPPNEPIGRRATEIGT